MMGAGGDGSANVGDMAGQCPTNKPPAATVSVFNDYYMPQIVNVPVCGKVRWEFQGSTHGVYPQDMRFPASPVMSQGTYEYVFPTAGTFDYICAIHGVMMPGRVIVK